MMFWFEGRDGLLISINFVVLAAIVAFLIALAVCIVSAIISAVQRYHTLCTLLAALDQEQTIDRERSRLQNDECKEQISRLQVVQRAQGIMLEAQKRPLRYERQGLFADYDDCLLRPDWFVTFLSPSADDIPEREQLL